MMVAEATETCRCILKYDEAYFISVHLLVYDVSVNLLSKSIYEALHY